MSGLPLTQLVAVFERTFADERTLLVGGAEEPLYQPWDDDGIARIHFRADYRASALHEVAHWCIAGRRRRGLVDFGYWYAPDGRDAAQQAAFERAEVRPQAVEWFLHLACGSTFHLSQDNLGDAGGDPRAFAEAVVAEACRLRRDGLPPRAQRLAMALAAAWPAGAEALTTFVPECSQLVAS